LTADVLSLVPAVWWPAMVCVWVAVPLPVMEQSSPPTSPPTLWAEGVLMALLSPMVPSLTVVM
jgi:hypothetical protein